VARLLNTMTGQVDQAIRAEDATPTRRLWPPPPRICPARRSRCFLGRGNIGAGPGGLGGHRADLPQRRHGLGRRRRDERGDRRISLNATIEAARAGEAGKWLAVAAAEVKELAQETVRAIEDISRRVEAIQGGYDRRGHGDRGDLPGQFPHQRLPGDDRDAAR
jgi:methyl-accepting chemotaxis protein-like sensor